MANSELVASIDINQMGLGAGGMETSPWHNEMLILTREMRDALNDLSMVARRESFFGKDGGDGGIGFLDLAAIKYLLGGGLGTTLTKLVPILTKISGVLGLLSLSGDTQGVGDLGGETPDYLKILEERGLGKDILGFTYYNNNDTDIAKVEASIRNIRKEMEDIAEGGVSEDEKTRLITLQTELLAEQNELFKLQNDDIEDSNEQREWMLSLTGQVYGLQDEVNNLLEYQTDQIQSSVSQQAALTKETINTLQAQIKLNRERMKALNMGGRIKRGTTRTYEVQDFGNLGPTRLEITDVSGWADAVRAGEFRMS